MTSSQIPNVNYHAASSSVWIVKVAIKNIASDFIIKAHIVVPTTQVLECKQRMNASGEGGGFCFLLSHALPAA